MNPLKPVYDRLSPRARQYLNIVLVGLAFLALALTVSALIGDPQQIRTAPEDLPKPRPLGAVPGAALDPKDAWMGGAGKDVAQLRNEVRTQSDELVKLRAEVTHLRESRTGSPAVAAVPQAVPAAAPAEVPPAAAAASMPQASAALPRPAPQRVAAPPPFGQAPMSPPVNAPMAFPPRRSDPGETQAYPPGAPNRFAPPDAAAQPAEAAAHPAPTMLKVALAPDAARASEASRGAAAEPTAAAGRTPVPRRVGSFLPIGYVRAVLLGGLAAPTGGQAQSNPVPVLLRLDDRAMLPNGFRGQVKDCLVVAEGFGDASAERAYIRTTLLSCVQHDGRVLEVPLKGSVFGEDGMNGMMGKLVTKQGAILTQALLAGIASGIGSGISNATQNVTNTALGSVTNTPTDANSILKQGLGTGVSRALDRLANYYIALAERTFPVIEVQPGRRVDIVVQQGIALDAAIAALAPGQATSPPRGGAADANRAALMRSLAGDEE